jgi:hypothetical protein
MHFLYRLGVIPAQDANESVKISGAKVFVDGNIIGYCAIKKLIRVNNEW